MYGFKSWGLPAVGAPIPNPCNIEQQARRIANPAGAALEGDYRLCLPRLDRRLDHPLCLQRVRARAVDLFRGDLGDVLLDPHADAAAKGLAKAHHAADVIVRHRLAREAGGKGQVLAGILEDKARFVLRDACEHLEFFPRASKETVTYDYLGGMMSFGETFHSRINRWIDQNVAGARPDEIDASGKDALKAQRIIEACIESWQTGTVVTL